ncbi:hypothetical protein HWV62_21296 [Athelia sp. TMB]|nr:hypothetical protein HWV62_21296 [Athelia sp. TMB]
MTMDVHTRYHTSAHDSVVARFILSLSSCSDCLALDNKFNVLDDEKDITPIDEPRGKGKDDADIAPTKLKASLADTPHVDALATLVKTLDQAQALLTFVDAIEEMTLCSTVTLTAAHGRGKSAALGLAIAAALAHGWYSNIFELGELEDSFLFHLQRGWTCSDMEEHFAYDIAQIAIPDFNKAIVRVNIFREHRQTIQYIQPEDAHVLGQAELVIIDEAAAILLLTDTLFSFQPASKAFLQHVIALYVAAHYNNQPNDLHLLSDAPANHLFVLLPLIKGDEAHLPGPLVVLQVALEGNISKGAIMDGLGRG